MVDTVVTEGIENKRYPINIGYIIIPAEIDRDIYVKQCFRKSVVSVQFEDGSHMLDIPCSVNILQTLDFPEQGGLGSCVVCGLEFKHNIPIVIGRLIKDDEATTMNENEFSFVKRTNNGEVSIVGSANNGNLFVNVIGRTKDEGGKIFINVSSPENSGEINVNLKGNLNIELQNMVQNVLNEYLLTTKNNINIDSTDGVINLGDTEETLEPILLGTKTVDELSKEIQALTDLLQSIASITPLPVTSGAPDGTWAVWQAAVAAIVDRGNLSAVKSEKTFSQ